MDTERMDRWRDELRRCGYRPADVLGSGMEGTVVDLGGGLLAKLWHRRTEEEVRALRTFYDAVAGSSLTLATPVVHRVLRLDDQVATVEDRLPGTPLRRVDEGGWPVLDDTAVGAVLEVLGGLAATAPAPGMDVLPVLPGEPPFRSDRAPFAESLAALVERRVDRFRTPLSRRLPGLERLVTAVTDRLRSLGDRRCSLVHGDLVPANVLVDATGVPRAVLDFGFLSTVGDPAFDAAVTASIFDMYGPCAAEHEATLDDALSDRFGYDAPRLGAYRAAYALATSNCYSASGADGHFEWCARMVERPAIRAALSS